MDKKQNRATILSWLIDCDVIQENAEVVVIEEETRKKMGKIKKEGILCSCCCTVFIIEDFYKHVGGTTSKHYEYILIAETCSSLLSSMVKAYFTNVGSDARTSHTRGYSIPLPSKIGESLCSKDRDTFNALCNFHFQNLIMPPRRALRRRPARRNIEEQWDVADRSRIPEFLRMNPPNFTGSSIKRDMKNTADLDEIEEVDSEDDELVAEPAVKSSQRTTWKHELFHPMGNLVFPLAYGMHTRSIERTIIGTRWVFRNKLDENGIITRNKSRLVVQVYADDIIFGATSDAICKDFSILMGSEFEMSMIGELKFFLGGTCICQEKYIKEMLKRFIMLEEKKIDTPMGASSKHDNDKASALNLAKNLLQHKRTKHISVKHPFLRDNVDKGNVIMKFGKAQDQVDNIFTKALRKDQFFKNRLRQGLLKQN
ncbi:hypothetical protein MTR67_048060 [Solanum verrucosum]|uniref:Reverse transcriptase Ty1/copia-type domain-containing protein n=1 Tax=Solanum verrucosum TaxID=315347 RepID=A0AAF0UYX6_SOLVR|nr:hypothetical protein MTR67_048060 [Solanum verrucosum]